MKSEFGTWFVEQFGNRPGGNKSTFTLDQDVRGKQYAFRKAETLLRKREKYDARMDTALKAWVAGRLKK